eukprot:CAMPEP_0168594544 /NCGR_PEP_ID=MMETSP0420-20121227/8959_1 /TAXON_ID=498008 /ORGANISM="Pessonella sp." /LENGTH=82 /DNA_ID=CAMNT_0008630879 /DNA_START=74 /DNA_END=322 /DNA_ORIENTATION=+
MSKPNENESSEKTPEETAELVKLMMQSRRMLSTTSGRVLLCDDDFDDDDWSSDNDQPATKQIDESSHMPLMLSSTSGRNDQK